MSDGSWCAAERYDQASSDRSSPGVPKLEFVGLSSAWRSCAIAFRYHQVAASPPARTEAAATTVSLSHPGETESTGFEVDEDEDSKEFVIILQGLLTDSSAVARG